MKGVTVESLKMMPNLDHEEKLPLAMHTNSDEKNLRLRVVCWEIAPTTIAVVLTDMPSYESSRTHDQSVSVIDSIMSIICILTKENVDFDE